MLSQTSLGIDIQKHQLSLVALKAAAGSVQVLADGVYPLALEMEEPERVDAIKVLIQDFLKGKNISPGSVFMSIPRNTTVIRYIELPSAVKENLRETLSYELEKYIPFRAEEVYFDYQVVFEEKSEGRLRLLLVVVQKEAVDSFLALSNSINLGISGVEISATAFCNALFQKGRKGHLEKVEAFVYVQGDQIELGFIKDGILHYSRTLPLHEDSGKDVQSAYEKMLRHMQADDGPFRTVFCASDAHLSFLNDLKSTETMGALERLDSSSFQLSSTDLMGAYGLAVKGFQKVPLLINLLPLSLRKKPNKFKYYILFALISMVLAGALAWVGGVFFQHQWAIDRLDSEISRFMSEARKIDSIRSQKAQLLNRIEFLNTLRQGGPPVLDVLRELSNRIPDEAWVSHFSFSEKGVQIQGMAESASELIPLLEASPMFGGVAFLSAITKDRSGKERFKIGLSIK